MKKLSGIVIFLVSFSLLTPVAGAAVTTYKIGDKAIRIRIVQEKLIEMGYPIYKADGQFEESTLDAVKSFQKEANLPPDGIIDDKTLEQILGKNIVKPRKPSREKSIVEIAVKYQGIPYRFGGTTPSGFDCSGFVQFVFRQRGVVLPRSADEQYLVGKPVARRDLQPGDLVFFSTYEKGASHVGIYLGNGLFISATSSRGVQAVPLDSEYWKPRYLGARRII